MAHYMSSTVVLFLVSAFHHSVRWLQNTFWLRRGRLTTPLRTPLYPPQPSLYQRQAPRRLPWTVALRSFSRAS